MDKLSEFSAFLEKFGINIKKYGIYSGSFFGRYPTFRILTSAG